MKDGTLERKTVIRQAFNRYELLGDIEDLVHVLELVHRELLDFISRQVK